MNLDKIENHALRLRVKTLLQCLESEGRQLPKIHGESEPLELWWSKFSISFYDGSPVLHLQSRQGIGFTIREKGNLIPLDMHPKQPMYWVQEALRLAPKLPPVVKTISFDPAKIGGCVTWEHKRYTDSEVATEIQKTGNLPDDMTVYAGCICGWWWIGPKIAYTTPNHPAGPSKHECPKFCIAIARSGSEAEAIRKASELSSKGRGGVSWITFEKYQKPQTYVERLNTNSNMIAKSMSEILASGVVKRFEDEVFQQILYGTGSSHHIRFTVKGGDSPITIQIEPVKPKAKVGDTVEVGSLPVGTTVAFHGCEWKIWAGSQYRTNGKVELRSDSLGIGWEPHNSMCKVVSLPDAY